MCITLADNSKQGEPERCVG